MTGLSTRDDLNPRSFVKISRARDNQGEGERWSAEQVHPTLNAFDNGDARCVCAVVESAPLWSSACCQTSSPVRRDSSRQEVRP